MNQRLIFKLLTIHLVVIAFTMAIMWLVIDTLAAGYFVTLMEKYHISPEPAHEMFVNAVHRYLIWACLAALILAVVLSFFMMRRVLAPLTRMTQITQEIAAGNFSTHVPTGTQDEIGRLAQAFNRMAESLKKLESLRRSLMIDVAHELRTPLTNIRGYLEALNDGVLPPSTETFSCCRPRPCGWYSSLKMYCGSPGPMPPKQLSSLKISIYARPSAKPSNPCRTHSAKKN
jgi:HAMP domain-containing protein